jgi:hypothetical protein
MGADLLIMSIPELHPERMLEDRLALIDEITPAQATVIFQSAEQDDWESLYGGGDPDFGDQTELEFVQAKLREAVHAIHGGSREVTYIHVGDQHSQKIWLTGGMSWGEDPTEIWSAFSYLVETNIL